jgi:hypothetical protein
MKVLRGASSTAARSVLIGAGDELMRELGGEILKELH